MGTVENRDGHNSFTVERGGWSLSEPVIQLYEITVRSTGYVTGSVSIGSARFSKEDLRAIHEEIGRFIK